MKQHLMSTPTCVSASCRTAVAALLALLLAGSACAQSATAKPMASLKLKDGRVLENVELKTFNSKTVFVKCAQGLLQVPYEDFPAEMQPRLRAGLEETLRINQYRDETAAKVGLSEAEHAARREAEKSEKPAEKNPSAEEQLTAKIEKVARAKAENFFRYEYSFGSNEVAIRSLAFETEPPEASSGWTGRYTVKGMCHADYYESHAGSTGFGRFNRSFIVTVEVDDKGVAKAVKVERGVID